MTQKRKDGFYWVKFKADEPKSWCIAFFLTNHWDVFGTDIIIGDYEENEKFSEIDERRVQRDA